MTLPPAALRRIIISRTDALGDVALTLPLAGLLKAVFPQATIVFLCKAYARPLVACADHVDEIWLEEEFLAINALEGAAATAIIHVFPNKLVAAQARRLRIGLRIGTTNRWYHWRYANARVPLSRRHSPLHEAQLNAALLKPLGLPTTYTLEELTAAAPISPKVEVPEAFQRDPADPRRRIIIHPKSKGHGREWPLERYAALINALPEQDWEVMISGTEAEAAPIAALLSILRRPAISLCGQLTLPQLIAVIATADAFVASGTGPLHIAGLLGVRPIGLFPPMRPVHPGRWAPLGVQSIVLVKPLPDCRDCRKDPVNCACMRWISPEMVLEKLPA